MLTDDEARTLGERWIAAGGGWRPGMVVHVREFFATADREGVSSGRWGAAWPEVVGMDGRPPEARQQRVGQDTDGDVQVWPAFQYGATRGACLEVVREKWGADAHLAPVGDTLRPWRLISRMGYASGRTEAEALVSALEGGREELASKA